MCISCTSEFTLDSSYYAIFCATITSHFHWATLTFCNTLQKTCSGDLGMVVWLYDLQPHNPSAPAIDTTVDRKAERFEFVVPINVPTIVWTRRSVFPSSQTLRPAQRTTLGVKLPHGCFDDMSGNLKALKTKRVPDRPVSTHTPGAIEFLSYTLPHFLKVIQR